MCIFVNKEYGVIFILAIIAYRINMIIAGLCGPP